jgi:hypothetical protein
VPWRPLPALGYALRGLRFMLAAAFWLRVGAPGFHPLAGQAKDVGAAAVFLAIVAAVSIGLIVFGARLF